MNPEKLVAKFQAKQLSKKEVAAILGCSVRTLERQLESGRLKIPRYGTKRPFFLESEVYAYLESTKH